MSGLKGADELAQKLNRLASRAPERIAGGLYRVALPIMKKSMQRTPVLTGAARASHETQRPVVSGRDISVTIKVGGPSLGYVVPLHEKVEVHHENGEALFLSKSVNEAKPTFLQDLAREVNLEGAVQ